PGLPAVQKLESVFAGIARFKAERKELLLAILEVWVSDDNAVVREKFRHVATRRLVPLLSAIVRQGTDEGAFKAGPPDDAARVLGSLSQGFRDEAIELFIARQANSVTFEAVESRAAAYTEAFERILGIPAGSLTLIDEPTLRLWF